MWYREDDYETMDEEWERLQKEEVEQTMWEIENRISAEDLDNGPIAYDAITGRPIYEHGGSYDPGYDD